jgi:hypothetical protein
MYSGTLYTQNGMFGFSYVHAWNVSLLGVQMDPPATVGVQTDPPAKKKFSRQPFLCDKRQRASSGSHRCSLA